MSLGQYNSNPTRAHLLVAKRVLRYISGTRDYALEYNFTHPSPDPPTRLILPADFGVVDADWASDANTRRSVSGYAFFLYSSLVSWSSTKQKTVALSSTEAEYMALSHAIREAISIRFLLTSLDLPVPRPLQIFCDNKSALDIANSESTTSRSKHIDIRYHFIRDQLKTGSFSASWISTSDMITDILTKALPKALHYKFVPALGLVSRS
ncbi:Copia protein [Termitomyces sp. J132]|nr:Copia protein [Termitomyces sp. J132]